MARALERQGKIVEAIVELEQTPPSAITDLTLPAWPQCRAKLAELYRWAGRLDDATRVEDELRHYLSESDPDFPLPAQLNKTAAARPRGQ